MPRSPSSLSPLVSTAAMWLTLLGVAIWMRCEVARIRDRAAAQHGAASERSVQFGAFPREARPGGPRTSAGDAVLSVDLLLALSDRDPREALRLTGRVADDVRQRALRLAVVRRWATRDAAAAVAWAEVQPDGEWQPALAAAFDGAAVDAGAAIDVAEQLIARSPERAGDYGQYLIAGLAHAQAFAAAAEFAAGAPADLREAWLHDAFFHWAAEDPAAAARACEDLGRGEIRLLATKGLIAGWAKRDPAALAAYALNLETGTARAEAFSQALPQWVARDPAAVASWLVAQDLVADFDAGTVALATQPELLRTRPVIAVKWAASITEPTLRANTLRAVAMEWARRDPSGLSEYLASVHELPEPDRDTLRDGLSAPPDS